MKKNIITLVILVILAGILLILTNSKQPEAPVQPITATSSDITVEEKLPVPENILGSWVWKQTLLNNGEKIFPKKAEAFTLTLKEDGTLTGTTDCNNFFGSFGMKDKQLTFGPFGMTKMFCEGSQEMEFMKMVSDSDAYIINPSGELVLHIKFDSGSVVFTKK